MHRNFGLCPDYQQYIPKGYPYTDSGIIDLQHLACHTAEMSLGKAMELCLPAISDLPGHIDYNDYTRNHRNHRNHSKSLTGGEV